MVQSFLVYGFMILSFVLLGFIARKREHIFPYQNGLYRPEVILILILFSFFSGVRYNVGVDYPAYLENFKSVALGNIRTELDQEWLFSKLTEIFALNNIHFSWYFGILALVQILLILYTFKNEKYLYPFLLFALMANGTYFMWMNGIRQCIVINMFILSVKLIKQKKFLFYISWILLGYLIHRSAILLLPMYFILYNDRDYFKKRWVQLILMIIAIYFSYSNIWNYLVPIIQNTLDFLGYEKYNNIESHLSLRDKQFNRSIRFYFPLIINVLIVLYSNKLKALFKNHNFTTYYNIYFIGVLAGILFFNNSLMQRPLMYFIYSGFIIWAYFLYYSYLYLRYSYARYLFFVSVALIMMVILYAFIASDHYTYYRFYWE